MVVKMARKRRKRKSKREIELLKNIRRAELDIACYEISLFEDDYNMLTKQLRDEFGYEYDGIGEEISNKFIKK